MRIYLHLLAAFFLFFAGSIYANTQQEKRVTGTVTSEGEPLPGVSVQLKGASSGTITDIDGNYSIEAPVNGTLVFRFVGMKTVEQPVNNRNVINVTLDSESKELEEVMVVAYATAKKYSFTGAASTMKAGEIEKLQTSSVSRVLEGTVSGVQASAASGQPGTDAEIRIRGIGSINASSAPLYVVDGVPFDGSVNSINPDDISSMTVLKDAASAALYGSRGANGVIIITTKQGQQDSKATVKVKASLGGSNRAVRDYDRVSTNQYFELYWEALRNQYAKSSDYTSATAAAQASKDLVTKLMGGGPNPYGPQYAQPVGTDGKLVAGARPLWDSDWSDAMEQQALRTELNLSVSGGGKANQYFFSAGYLNDKGIALESGYQRFNLRSNITSEITSWLKGGVNLSFAHSMQNYPVSSDSKTSNVITAGRTMPGFYPIYEMNADGSYKLDDSGNRIYDFGSYRPSGSMANWNLPATLPLDKSERMKDEVSGRTFLEATIIEGLKFKTSFNFDLINYNTLDYTNPKLGPAKENGGGVSRLNTRTFSWTWNNIVTYDKTIGEHHFNVLAGMESYSYRYDELTASRSKMAQPDMPELVVGSQLTGGSGYRIDYALVGYLTQLLYDYRNKYFFSASYRRDGSSRFAPETRWGNFWSLGASWRVDRESFMASTSDWLSALTLKMSYGAQGNDNLGTYYASKGLYTIVSNLGENALVSDRMATPNLKWETTTAYDLGLDFGMWEDRLTVTFGYYLKKTKNLLSSVTLPTSLGFIDYKENLGQMENEGVELALRSFVYKSNDWNVSLFVNMAHNKNRIVSISNALSSYNDKADQEQANNDDYKTKPMVRYKEGRSSTAIYAMKSLGIDPATGKELFQRQDGTNTYVWDPKESVVCGDTEPKVTGAFGTNITWKQLNLNMNFSYRLGGQVYNQTLINRVENADPRDNVDRRVLEQRWQKPGDHTFYKDINDKSTTPASSRFIQDENVLQLGSLSLSYDLKKEWLKPIGFDMVRLTAMMNDVFRLSTVKRERGISYPFARSMSLGVMVQF